jgi:hypothetical protein
MRIRSLLVTTVIGASAAVGAGAPSASAHSAVDHSCGPAHRYIDAKSAVVKVHRVVIYGKHATLVCGGDDDSHYSDGSAVTLKMLKSGTVKVWKVAVDPSQGMRTIQATDLPHWLQKNRGEPIYKIHGPADAVTSLVEKWHP